MKICIIGKPGTGKTSLLVEILYWKSDIFAVGQVYSPTEEESQKNEFTQIFGRLFIFGDLDIEAVENFYKRQIYACKYINDPRAVIITDDCMTDPKLFKLPIFHKFQKNGRHKDFLHINTLQNATDMPSNLRGLFDGIFILREQSIVIRRKIWENYAGVIGDFNTFCQIMDQLTNDQHGIFIDNSDFNTNSNNLEDRVFWVKINPLSTYLGKFTIGCREYWDFNDQRYDKNIEEREMGIMT